MVRSAVLAVATLLVACDNAPDNAPIWTGDVTLGAAPLVVTPTALFRAPGPTHELCVVSSDSGVHPTVGGEGLALPGGKEVKVRVMLIAPSGARDSLYRRLPGNWLVTVGA